MWLSVVRIAFIVSSLQTADAVVQSNSGHGHSTQSVSRPDSFLNSNSDHGPASNINAIQALPRSNSDSNLVMRTSSPGRNPPAISQDNDSDDVCAICFEEYNVADIETGQRGGYPNWDKCRIDDITLVPPCSHEDCMTSTQRCDHSFCRGCIINLQLASLAQSRRMVCPSCRAPKGCRTTKVRPAATLIQVSSVEVPSRRLLSYVMGAFTGLVLIAGLCYIISAIVISFLHMFSG